MLTIIAAASENNALGKDNDLVWHLPDDFKRFKTLTTGHFIIMGRKTFESLGGKPLNGRLNIVITKQKDYFRDGIIVVESIDAAISFAKKNDYKEIMIAGGGEIYKQAFSITTKVLMTRVHTIIEGDTFFPALGNEWIKESSEPQLADEKHAFNFDFEIWQRK